MWNLSAKCQSCGEMSVAPQEKLLLKCRGHLSEEVPKPRNSFLIPLFFISKNIFLCHLGIGRAQ